MCYHALFVACLICMYISDSTLIRQSRLCLVICTFLSFNVFQSISHKHTLTHTHSLTHSHTHARTHARTDGHIHTRTRMHTHTHTHTHTQHTHTHIICYTLISTLICYAGRMDEFSSINFIITVYSSYLPTHVRLSDSIVCPSKHAQ